MTALLLAAMVACVAALAYAHDYGRMVAVLFLVPVIFALRSTLDGEDHQ